MNVIKESTIQHIKDRITQKKLSFLLPTAYISPEAAQAGLLLNTLFNLNKQTPKKITYKSFFANSSIEALQGAIKISRHYALSKRKESSGRILVYDLNPLRKAYFNPLNKPEAQALIPAVHFSSDLSEIENNLQHSDFIACVLRVNDDLSESRVNRIFELCRENNIITILDESEMNYDSNRLYSNCVNADIYVLGESLTNKQIPFSTFSMSDNIYKPWNTLSTCLLHSSTYSGNCLALSFAIKTLRHILPSSAQVDKQLSLIAEDHRACLQNYSAFVNPMVTRLYQLAGYDINVASAQGMLLKTKEAKTLLDAAGCGGCNLRGHNPSDLIDEVLNKHEPARDYWALLEKTLNSQTGLTHAFPGISGASAVETAIIMALLANPKRTRIVTFKGNYAGKTLIALNGTQQQKVFTPFGPLYFDLCVIDPYHVSSLEHLEQELLSDSIALVWFESLSHAEPLPDKLLHAINTHKNKGGYFIGVDEVLMGIHRTGNFLHCQGIIESPDLISLSKGLSDMSFPISATLVSQKVYENAALENPDLINALQTIYLNQLGSHISLHALQKITTSNTANHVKRMGKILREGLEDIVKSNPLFSGVGGEGLFLRLEINKNHLLTKIFTEDLTKIFITRICIQEGNCLLFLGSIIPPLNITESEINQLVKSIRLSLYDKKPLSIVLSGLKQILKLLFPYN